MASIKDIYAPWIRVVRLPFTTVGGAGPATNAGLDCARGKYVVLLDGDDIMLPTAVEEMVKTAEAAPEPPDYIMAQYLEFAKDDQSDAHQGFEFNIGRYWNPSNDSKVRAMQSKDGELFHPLSELAFGQTSPQPWRLLLNRDFLNTNHIRMREIDGTFEDNSFKAALDMHATKVAVVRKALYHHRKMRKSATTFQVVQGDQDLEFHATLRNIWNYVQQYGYIVDELENAAERWHGEAIAVNQNVPDIMSMRFMGKKLAANIYPHLAQPLINDTKIRDGTDQRNTVGFVPHETNNFAQVIVAKVASLSRMNAFPVIGETCDKEVEEMVGTSRPYARISSQDPLLGKVASWSDDHLKTLSKREASVRQKWRAKIYGAGDSLLMRMTKIAIHEKWSHVLTGLACIRWGLAGTSAPVGAEVALTVAIPFKNAPTLPRKLKELVAKLKAQKGLTFEIIVVDNNSDDGFQVEVEAVADDDSNVFFMREPNSGAGRARNLALKAASGKYVFFLDADDNADAAQLAQAVKYATENKHDVLMLPYRLSFINGENKASDSTRAHELEGKMMFHDERNFRAGQLAVEPMMRKWAAYQLINYPWNRIAHREMLRRNVIFFPPFVVQNDVPYHWLTIAHSSNIGFFDKAVATHREVDLDRDEAAKVGLTTITNDSSNNRFQALHSAAYTYLQLMKIDEFRQQQWAPRVWAQFYRSLILFAERKVPAEKKELLVQASNQLLQKMFVKRKGVEMHSQQGQSLPEIVMEDSALDAGSKVFYEHSLEFAAPHGPQCDVYQGMVNQNVQDLLWNGQL